MKSFLLSLLLLLPIRADVVLTWNDNSTDETSFKLERAGADQVYSTLATLTTNVVAHTDQTTLPSTLYYYRISALNANGASGFASTSLTTPPASGPNTVPTISTIANRAINENTNTGPLAFTVGDLETPPASLVVSGGSSNLALVPNGSIVFGGSGADRTLTVTPLGNQSGIATIAYGVSDGTLGASDTFVLTVNATNDPPTISNIADRTIASGTTTGPVSFTVGDDSTLPANLTLIGTSSNQALVPNTGIIFGGTGSSRTVTITPVVQNPVTTITVAVSDGFLTATDNFVLTVGTAPPPGPGSSTQTFSNVSPIVIPDVGKSPLYPSVVNVTGMTGTVVGVTVTLKNLSHSYGDDIDVLLVGPGGQKVMVMSDAGSSFPIGNATLNLTQTAPLALTNSQIISGTFRPTDLSPGETRDTFPAPAPIKPYGSSLLVFNGTDPNGTWLLYVQDDGAGDQGSIAGGWSLTITTQ